MMPKFCKSPSMAIVVSVLWSMSMSLNPDVHVRVHAFLPPAVDRDLSHDQAKLTPLLSKCSSSSSSSSSSRYRCLPSGAQSKSTLDNGNLSESNADAEVVGSSGRIGSFLLRSLSLQERQDHDYEHDHDHEESEKWVVANVPRNEELYGRGPGFCSPNGRPIFVSVPATQISNVVAKTLLDRRNDLIFVTNGIPSDYLSTRRGGGDDDGDGNGNGNSDVNVKSDEFLQDGINNMDEDQYLDRNQVTTCVPHFAVLRVGDDPIPNISTTCPPTVIHGRHAQVLSNLLTEYGLKTEIASSLQQVDAAAIRKLMWVSIMWLLCHEHDHDNEDYSINVKEVHESKYDLLQTLVEELIPAANLLLKQFHDGGTDANDTAVVGTGIGTVDQIVEYMQHYSFSMPNAIPNKQLAIDEFGKRNGLLLQWEDEIPQPNHLRLVSRVVGYIPRG